MTSEDQIPAHLVEAIHETEKIVMSFFQVLVVIIAQANRDHTYAANHLLFPLSQDLLESTMAVRTLTREGMKSVVKRELRFILEATIKLCFVQQTAYEKTIEEKLSEFEKELESSRIPVRLLRLHMLSEKSMLQFIDEVGRLYPQNLQLRALEITPNLTPDRGHRRRQNRWKGE